MGMPPWMQPYYGGFPPPHMHMYQQQQQQQ
jgi:hypothetical protein